MWLFFGASVRGHEPLRMLGALSLFEVYAGNLWKDSVKTRCQVGSFERHKPARMPQGKLLRGLSLEAVIAAGEYARLCQNACERTYFMTLTLAPTPVLTFVLRTGFTQPASAGPAHATSKPMEA